MSKFEILTYHFGKT